MKITNIERIEYAKTILDSWNIIYRELPNGQLQVNGANFWATSEKWHDPKSDTKGVGLDSFVRHIRGNEQLKGKALWDLIEEKAQMRENVCDSWKLTMVDLGVPMSSAVATYRLTNVVTQETRHGYLENWRN